MRLSKCIVSLERAGKVVETDLAQPTLLLAAVLSFVCLIATPTLAQETEAAAEAAEEEQTEQTEEEAPPSALAQAELAGVEEVVVTGSRIRRSTYTSITPLQIISADVKREAGLIDAGKILQETSTASGVQFDLSFNGFVLDDGPGSTTANLRGLGAHRTLVLLNGRRIAPTGVEGAPSSPNLSIVPGLLVQQYDQLLDGASSIYGSDAVAGVINAILRKDFDGFTLEASPSHPHHGAGAEQAFGVSWGRNWDRGFIGFGAQHRDVDPVTLADRPWTAGCNRHYEVDQAGRIRNRDLRYTALYGMEWDDCTVGSLIGRTIVPRAGSIYYTPGYTNGGWPDFSESGASWVAGTFGIDGDVDGRTDVTFRDYSLNGREQFAHLFSPFRSTTAMLYGEYTLEGEANLTPYFELLYGTAAYNQNSGAGQFFPWVPALNPYNICNPEGLGVDCGLAQDAMYANPGYIAGFNGLYGGLCARFGIPATACGPHAFGLTVGPLGPQRTLPVVSVRGDRNTVDADNSWQRAVLGLSGDVPFLNVGSLSDWTFDLSFSRSHSDSSAQRIGVRRDRLDLALGYYSMNWNPCERNLSPEVRESRNNSLDNPLDPIIAADAEPGCVPVNMYAPSLYPLIGDFGTQAERDYLFGTRNFDTQYTQSLFTLYFTGNLFPLPAGDVAAGVGVEYRTDEIASIPDQVAREGLFWGFFADGGAEGEKYTREFFGEIEAPVLGGKRGVEELTVNLSARYTDDEFYGGAWTGAAKIGWRPIESLLVRGTFGTSYRAPNLRELFLRSQTGFLTVSDPCFVPENAFEDTVETGGERIYNADLDPRDPHVLERCRAEGVDPTIAGDGSFTAYSVESAAGGSLTLDEETSESMSVGFAWEQPFTTVFGLTLGMTYYDIDIEDTIIEPTLGYIVFDCYVSRNSTGQFCSRITRNLQNARDPRIRLVDRGFINRDRESVRGVDLNLTVDTTLTVFERPLDVSVDVTGHRLIERSTLFVNDAGEASENQDAREWFYAERKAELALRLDYERWRLSWQSRYISGYDEYRGTQDEWGDINSDTPFSSTCLGPPDDLMCRDVETAPDYWIHHVSLSYRQDTWRVIAGSRNVFDEPPPQVDDNELWSATNNTPLGVGYDLNGRTFFLSLTYRFGGES